MSLVLAMVLVGSLLVYAGWKNLSVPALLTGNNTTPKPGSGYTPGG